MSSAFARGVFYAPDGGAVQDAQGFETFICLSNVGVGGLPLHDPLMLPVHPLTRPSCPTIKPCKYPFKFMKTKIS